MINEYTVLMKGINYRSICIMRFDRYGLIPRLNFTFVVDFWTASGIRSHKVIPHDKGLLDISYAAIYIA